MVRTKQTARKSTGGRPPGRIIPRGAPIHLAAASGKVKVLRLLLKQGKADIRKRDGLGRTPLHHAVVNGHVDAVKLLRANGAPVSTWDKKGLTPLCLAAASGFLEVFNILLTDGALALVSSVNEDGQTILHHASIGGSPAIARAVLDNGVSISARDKKQSTAIDLAVCRKNWDVVKVLLDEGRRRRLSALSQPHYKSHPPPAADDVNDSDVLIMALRSGLEGDPFTRNAVEAAARLGLARLLVQLIEEHGCDPDATALPRHDSPIVCASDRGHLECVTTLLSHGAKVDGTKNSRGGRVSALWVALIHKHDNIAAILLGAGACPEVVGGPNPQYSEIQALADRGPTVAAQFLAHIPDISRLSIWIILLAEEKHVQVLSEYYRVISPAVHAKYTLERYASPVTKLLFMLSATAAGPASSRPRTRSVTAQSHSQEHRRRTITSALDAMFVAVSFLLAAVDLEALKEIFADTPRFLENAHRLLPSRLDCHRDIRLISRLGDAGYTHPSPPGCQVEESKKVSS